MAGGEAGRSLAVTPTWAIAAVCTVMVMASFAMERLIHRLGLWLKRTKQKAWRDALERMKEELMLLGFISLTITVSQSFIVKICLPSHVLTKFTPCSPDDAGTGPTCQSHNSKAPTSSPNRELFEYGLSRLMHGRALAVEESDPCQGGCAEGHEPMVSAEGIAQLHHFVFVLAFVHVFFSAVTMALSMLKVHSWKKWEEEAQAENLDSTQAELTKGLTRQSTFVRRHASAPWSRNSVLLWIGCFFRQFVTCVKRSDYLALRLGFLTNHNFDRTFNFHRYMVRSMEEEFKKVVGISAYLWAFVVCFLLLNIDGIRFYFWAALVPPIMLLLIGTKLHHIKATLALENADLQGPTHSHQVRPRDALFWLNSPELLLGLIHFVLFQNSFELATFFWTWWQFSLSSCFLDDKAFNIIRLCLGFLVQIISSYSTLPLYAIVSQMGSNYKLGDNVKGALHGWRNRVKQRMDSAHSLGGHSAHQGGQSISLQPRNRDAETQAVTEGTEAMGSRGKTAPEVLTKIRVTVEGEAHPNR